MMIEVSGVQLPLDAGLPGGERLVRSAAANAIGLKAGDISRVELVKRSVDARKNDVRFIATLAVECGCAADSPKLKPAKGVQVKEHVPYRPLEIPRVEAPEGEPRPVVVGTGPAGLFAGLYLARAGLRPLVLERGGDVDERTRAVEAFGDGATLDFVTNVQFGEGGAGTFSDGKLTTGTKSPLARHVLQWFVEAGAPAEILWQAKPHIGTDKLVEVVRTMRRQIEEAGGEVRFHARLDDVCFDENGHIEGIIVQSTPSRHPERSAEGAEPRELHVEGARASHEREEIPCTTLILACGHSARDTFRMLQRANVVMEPKPFSVGVRIEHLQKAIDHAQYGKAAGHPALGAADYKLVAHLPGGRSVYTFCMCPGGEVVAAASEDFGVVVNGMSRFARDGENANAALLVGVTPDDFASADPLAGTVFQRRIEQAAYGEAVECGGEPWQAPAQTVGDLLAEKAGNPSRTVKPSYPRGVVWCDLREVLPGFVIDALVEAIPLLDRKLHGFADPDAVMTGVETRSSSPVRIVRDDETLQASTLAVARKVRARDVARGHGLRAGEETVRRDVGIYPCGEGPGYAGGIMSAAVDGLRVAQRVAEDLARGHAGARRDGAGLEAVIAALKAGEAVVFPTDTVVGLGVSVAHCADPGILFELKGRPAGKPVAWLVADASALDEFGVDVPQSARDAVAERWPGAFTAIVKAGKKVPVAYRSEQGTIGLRLPACDVVRDIIRAVGGPLAVTSANPSGGAAPRRVADVAPELLARAVALRLPDEGSGRASAVVDFTCDPPRTLR